MTTPNPEATPTQTPTATPPEGDATATPDWVKELPENLKWVGKELQEARTEAARYRTERNDLREQLTGAKSPEEVEALQKQVHDLEVTHRRAEAARKHNVPEDLLDFLTAEDEAGLEAQATKLARGATPPAAPKPTATPPSGGLQPLGDPGAGDLDGRAEYKRWKESQSRL